jgi:MoxR-like ATPase
VAVLPADSDADRVVITGGKVRCRQFPFVVLTSNGERELPPPFLRRCLRLDIPVPDRDKLGDILRAHLRDLDPAGVEGLLAGFVERRDAGHLLATDQLLNAVFLVTRGQVPEGEERQAVLDVVLRELGRT